MGGGFVGIDTALARAAARSLREGLTAIDECASLITLAADLAGLHDMIGAARSAEARYRHAAEVAIVLLEDRSSQIEAVANTGWQSPRTIADAHVRRVQLARPAIPVPGDAGVAGWRRGRVPGRDDTWPDPSSMTDDELLTEFEMLLDTDGILDALDRRRLLVDRRFRHIAEAICWRATSDTDVGRRLARLLADGMLDHIALLARDLHWDDDPAVKSWYRTMGAVIGAAVKADPRLGDIVVESVGDVGTQALWLVVSSSPGILDDRRLVIAASQRLRRAIDHPTSPSGIDTRIESAIDAAMLDELWAHPNVALDVVQDPELIEVLITDERFDDGRVRQIVSAVLVDVPAGDPRRIPDAWRVFESIVETAGRRPLAMPSRQAIAAAMLPYVDPIAYRLGDNGERRIPISDDTVVTLRYDDLVRLIGQLVEDRSAARSVGIVGQTFLEMKIRDATWDLDAEGTLVERHRKGLDDQYRRATDFVDLITDGFSEANERRRVRHGMWSAFFDGLYSVISIAVPALVAVTTGPQNGAGTDELFTIGRIAKDWALSRAEPDDLDDTELISNLEETAMFAAMESIVVSDRLSRAYRLTGAERAEIREIVALSRTGPQGREEAETEWERVAPRFPNDFEHLINRFVGSFDRD